MPRHIMPGNACIGQYDCNSQKNKKFCLSAIFTFGGQQKSFLEKRKQKINRRRSNNIRTLCNGCPIPINPLKKFKAKINMATDHVFRCLFHNCRERTKRIQLRMHAEPFRPISKRDLHGLRYFENGKNVSINKKSGNIASKVIVIFSMRILKSELFSCDVR